MHTTCPPTHLPRLPPISPQSSRRTSFPRVSSNALEHSVDADHARSRHAAARCAPQAPHRAGLGLGGSPTQSSVSVSPHMGYKASFAPREAFVNGVNPTREFARGDLAFARADSRRCCFVWREAQRRLDGPRFRGFRLPQGRRRERGTRAARRSTGKESSFFRCFFRLVTVHACMRACA